MPKHNLFFILCLSLFAQLPAASVFAQPAGNNVYLCSPFIYATSLTELARQIGPMADQMQTERLAMRSDGSTVHTNAGRMVLMDRGGVNQGNQVLNLYNSIYSNVDLFPWAQAEPYRILMTKAPINPQLFQDESFPWGYPTTPIHISSFVDDKSRVAILYASSIQAFSICYVRSDFNPQTRSSIIQKLTITASKLLNFHIEMPDQRPLTISVLSTLMQKWPTLSDSQKQLAYNAVWSAAASGAAVYVARPAIINLVERRGGISAFLTAAPRFAKFVAGPASLGIATVIEVMTPLQANAKDTLEQHISAKQINKILSLGSCEEAMGYITPKVCVDQCDPAVRADVEAFFAELALEVNRIK